MPDVQKLRELRQLLDDGTLSQEEYEKAKAQVLAEGDSPSPPPPPSAPAPSSENQVNRGGGRPGVKLIRVLSALAAGLGMILVAYRLIITLYVLYFASMLSSCFCNVVDADDISGGFGGAWDMAGKFYSSSDGDTLMQLVYFFSSSEITSIAWVLTGVGILGVVVSSMLER